MLLKRLRFCTREYERDAIAVGGHARQELFSVWAIWWVAPHAALPLAGQTIVIDGELLGRCAPRLELTCARIHIERAQRMQKLWWCQPIVRGRRASIAACLKR